MQTLPRFFSIISRGVLVATAFLVPVVALPWASEPLEIHKQTMLVFLVVVAACAWLGSVFAGKYLLVRQEWLFLSPLLALLVGILSSGFRAAPFFVVFGEAGGEYASLLTLAACVLFAFLVVHVADRSMMRGFLIALLAAGGVVSMYVLAQFAGLVPEGMPYTLVGTPNAAAIFLLAVVALGSALFLTSSTEKRENLIVGMIFLNAFALLLLLLAIDYSVLWGLTLAVMGVLFVFVFLHAPAFPRLGRFALPCVLFALALAFLLLPSPIASPFPGEVSLSHKGSVGIVQNVLATPSVWLGTGAGTFPFVYEQFHDPSIANTDFWNVPFDRASSHMFTMLATFGIVGTVLFLMFSLGIFATTLATFIRFREGEAWKDALPPFMGWITLFVAQFVYPANMTLMFTFWLFSGVLLTHRQSVERIVQFARSPRRILGSAFLGVGALVVLIVVFFVTGSRYSADIAFARAIALDRARAPIDDVIVALDRSALRNRFSDIYYRNLAHALLLKIGVIVGNPDADSAMLEGLVGASINAGRRASELVPMNVANLRVEAEVYREVSPLIENAENFAIAAAEQAVSLSPANPLYRVDLARAFLARADKRALTGGDEAEALAGAEEALLVAVELRPAYAVARYYLAVVYERQGKITDAIASMETLRSANPADVGVAMQLGLLYLKQGKTDLAEAELLRALSIAPDYANAHWYLASIYEEEGDIAKAIASIEAVARLNPGNALVEERLTNLRAGLAAPTLPEPVEEGEEVE